VATVFLLGLISAQLSLVVWQLSDIRKAVWWILDKEK
jgi:hypothetical protein